MEQKPKINLKRYTLPKASKKYLFRIIAYIVLLSVLGGLLYYMGDEKKKVEEVEKIEGVIVLE